MAKELVISFAPTGQTEALHMDEFPLRHLGDMKIERASTIEFNEDTQLFDVVLPDGTVHITHANFVGYDVARSFEVEWLQQCRLEEVAPNSYRGRTIADNLRREDGEGAWMYPEGRRAALPA